MVDLLGYVPHVAAFAIEDLVQFSLMPISPAGGHDWRPRWSFVPEGEVAEVRYEAPLDTGKPYFSGVREHMFQAMLGLYEYARLRNSADTASLFASIRIIAVSIPGVIEGTTTVRQLPLWSWPTTPRVQWEHEGRTVLDFNFQLEMTAILREISIEKNDRSLQKFLKGPGATYGDRVEVYNDCAACAAAELQNRQLTASTDQRSFIFIKAHDGVNVGAVEEGQDSMPLYNAELGHIFPSRHPDDDEAQFAGVCYFHKACIEGLVSSASLYARAVEAQEGGPFWHWGELVREHGIEKGDDEALCRLLLGDYGDEEVMGQEDACQLVGYYLAQLGHVISLYPRSPDLIIVGGRMATPEVLFWMRRYLFDLWNRYPAREHFDQENLDQYVVKSEMKEPRRREITGALAIALSHVQPGFQKKPKKRSS